MTLSSSESVFHARVTARLVWATGLVYSAALALGGPTRWSSPSTAVARQVPGGVYTWATLLGAASLIGAVGSLWVRSPRVAALGITACGGWYLFLAVLAIVAVQRDSRASFAAPVVYVALAAWSLVGLLVVRNATPPEARVAR